MARLVLQVYVGGEPVMIGDDISVKATKVRGLQVHLTFEAPRDVRIDRLAVWKERRHSAPPRSRRKSA